MWEVAEAAGISSLRGRSSDFPISKPVCPKGGAKCYCTPVKNFVNCVILSWQLSFCRAPLPPPLPSQVLTIGATNLAQDLDQACSSPPSSSLPLQVLTIGATNLAQDLDQALLRPGRFEAVFEIPSPGQRCLYISRCTPTGIIVLLLHRSHS